MYYVRHAEKSLNLLTQIKINVKQNFILMGKYRVFMFVYSFLDMLFLSTQLINIISVATLKKVKTLDRPLKKPRKPQVKFLCNWLTFLEKSNFSRKKSNFSGKSVLFSAKISDDFFWSSTLIFEFSPFYWPKTKKTTADSLLFQQKTLGKTTTDSLLLQQTTLGFSKKTLENMCFPGKY